MTIEPAAADGGGGPSRMRASDADRERVAGVLRDAYAEGRLSLVEHQERLGEVYDATTYGELAAALTDLPVPTGVLAVPATADVVPAQRNELVVDPGRVDAASSSATAIFGGVERKGFWVVPPDLQVTAVFGGADLDLTEAVFTAKETVVNVVCVMGGVQLTVPPGVVVRNEATAVFGGVSTGDGGSDGTATLVIRGFLLFGGVDVTYPIGRAIETPK